MREQAGLPKEGDIVAGKYRIEKVAGEGGMGVVYAAHHLVLDRRVALKVLMVDRARGDEVIERFVREAQAAARLQSEHVVRVMDAGSLENDLPFFVMEHLEGCDLADMLSRTGPLGIEDLADYTLQVLAALAQAHAAGIIHRDLKPANLFLATAEEGRKIIKILDFGISKQESDRAQWKQLTGQTILGTPSYMSPEQLRSSKNVDERADIWSLGVTLYELASGELPFNGDGPGEVFAAILEHTPTPIRSHRPDLPEAFQEILTRCLQRNRDARFEDVRAMAEAVLPLGSGSWAHLMIAIERSLACSKRFAVSNAALVTAAVAAARTSLPPAAESSLSASVLSVELPFTPTCLDASAPAASLPAAPARARAKRRSWLTFAGAATVVPLLVGTTFLTARTPAAASVSYVAAAPSPVVLAPAPAASSVAPEPSKEETEPPAAAEEKPALPSAAPSASAHPPSSPRAPVGLPVKRSTRRPVFLNSRD